MLSSFFEFSKTIFMAEAKMHIFNIPGLQIIFQNLLDIMSGRNEIPSDIYKNLLDINFYKNLNKIQLLLRKVSPPIYKGPNSCNLSCCSLLIKIYSLHA